MRRYWIRFALNEEVKMPPGTKVGCGVTACDKREAMNLIKEKVFKGAELPEIVECVENVDVSELDSGHVLPNMGNPALFGVWFPLGYD